MDPRDVEDLTDIASSRPTRDSRGDDVLIIDGGSVPHERYPCCVVWTPLPVITWFLPFIGHMGICDSHGVPFDFAGPYFVNEDCMAFGNPTKYWRIDHIVAPGSRAAVPAVPLHRRFDTWLRACFAPPPASELAFNPAHLVAPRQALEQYDDSVYATRDYFRKTQMYNLFCNNCHSFVAMALEGGNVGKAAGYKWNMVWLTWYLFWHGRYTSFPRFLATWLPFLFVCTVIVLFSSLIS